MVRSVIGPFTEPDGTTASGVFQLNEVFGYITKSLWPIFSDTLSYDQIVKLDAPVSYWRLGESSGTTAVDEMGANNGTYNGSPTLGATGLLTDDTDTSVDFDGTDDYVDGIGNLASGGTALSVEGWVNWDSFPANLGGRVIARSDGQFILYLFRNDGDSSNHLRYHIYTGGTQTFAQYPVSSLVVDTTYHVVGTWDGTNIRLYVNGEEVGITAKSGTLDAGTGSGVHLGDDQNHNYEHDGQLDEIAIYDYALTPTQIRRHYYRGLGYTGYALEVLATGPVRYWRLDEASGTTAIDETGAFDGTYINSPTLGGASPYSEFNTAVSFDGVDQDVSIGSALSGETQWSMACWFKTGTANGSQNEYILSEGNTADIDHVVAMYVETNAQNGKLGLWTKDGTTNLIKDDTGTAVNDDQWHFAVGVRDGDDLSLYLDGTKLWTITGSSQGASTLNTGGIGSLRRTTTSNYTEGEMDEVAMWRSVLTDYDVRRMYYAAQGYTGYALEVLASGPVSWWKLDDSAAPYSNEVGAETLSVHAGDPTGGAIGLIGDGTSVDFDGVGDALLGQTVTADLSSFSAEAWVNLDAYQAPADISSSVYFVQTASSDSLNCSIEDDGTLELNLYDDSAATNRLTLTPTDVLSLNTTYHIVCTFDGTTGKIYLNGEEIDSGTATAGMDLDTSFTAYIGSHVSAPRELDGRIDSVSIYDRALSANEIRAHYNQGVGLNG